MLYAARLIPSSLNVAGVACSRCSNYKNLSLNVATFPEKTMIYLSWLSCLVTVAIKNTFATPATLLHLLSPVTLAFYGVLVGSTRLAALATPTSDRGVSR